MLQFAVSSVGLAMGFGPIELALFSGLVIGVVVIAIKFLLG